MAPTGQRVLFVGATGHIGSFIAKEAAAKGHHVTALVSERSLGDPGKKAVLEELKAAGVQLTKGTLDAPQSTLVELAKKADVVRSPEQRWVFVRARRLRREPWLTPGCKRRSSAP